MPYAVEFQDVVKHFPGAGYNALDHVSIQIESGELVTILGTSGCGKTTMIKMINRLYEADSGKILVDGTNVQELDPVKLRQRIGFVIQQIGLFPHMTVYENIATVPKILKWEKSAIDQRVNELLELIRLEPSEFRDRYPAQLSGGQQQRIGLVRALAADPKLMLLDEPFGAIDAITREKLQEELIRIHRASTKTFLFVTHDIHEAFRLGTKVIIMDKGQIVQYDTPAAIRLAPATDFVKELIESGSRSYSQGEGI